MNDVGQSLAAAEIQSGSLSRRGVNMQFALLVLALGGVIWGSGAQTGCSDCQLASCPAVLCRVPELLAEDECGCCKRCLGVQGERCGGQGLKHGRCAPGYVCLTSADGPKEEGEREKDEKEESEDEEGTGACVCKHDYPVCGSDTNTYPTICALHLASWVSVHQQEGKIHKTHDGECKYAPVIILSPKPVLNVTGAQVYLVCEVKAVPTPIVTWRKVTESPKGVKLLEELPGDRVNVAVQVRGGPSKYESTGWVLINPLTKEDEGVYQCHASNILGEAQIEGTIKIMEKVMVTKDKIEEELEKKEN
ncbi:LOW QUALITY PROTEIN: insulin-like growth factor-binding protein-like 1 [Leucoraja erinacea]|uniref:LOW QUALITY PROTEIN: insulin-like growth factor-binding protein-like 1 n=1 Tax=Leucoraja erinaceus TaxID=7782 RepID=UPI002455EAE0|nr:LOW QUALITY PROTEIN: insulin-like growth factor-binding protein-like 1 [Leucoraja erinacea]